MSVTNFWNNDGKEYSKISPLPSSEWTLRSPIASPRSSSPPSGTGEAIFHKYIDIIHSKPNLPAEAKQSEPLDRPFDFFDDEEFAFGINLLNNNVACVGENITKLIQMGMYVLMSKVKKKHIFLNRVVCKLLFSLQVVVKVAKQNLLLFRSSGFACSYGGSSQAVFFFLFIVFPTRGPWVHLGPLATEVSRILS